MVIVLLTKSIASHYHPKSLGFMIPVRIQRGRLQRYRFVWIGPAKEGNICGFPALIIIGELLREVLYTWPESRGIRRWFGLIYVDYRTQVRTLKDSALWYAGVIRENGENL